MSKDERIKLYKQQLKKKGHSDKEIDKKIELLEELL